MCYYYYIGFSFHLEYMFYIHVTKTYFEERTVRIDVHSFLVLFQNAIIHPLFIVYCLFNLLSMYILEVQGILSSVN